MAISNEVGLAELQTLNYIFQKNSLQIIHLNGLTEEHFNSYKKQFKFIIEFHEQYNQLPSKDTFNSKFNNEFTWLDTITDPEHYLVGKLKENKLYRELVVEFKDMAELLKNEKSAEAVELMATLSQKFLKEKATPCVDLITNAQERLDNYIEKVNNPDKSFISTGIEQLDKVLGGWDVLNESAVIAARTGVGKSWWLIYFALEAAKQGFTVGYYSGEMETDLVGYRLDTFLGNIPNGHLIHGNNGVRLDYEKYIENINNLVPGHIYCITPQMMDGSATVSKLRAFIEKYDIQMLCVDQFSLLDDQRRGKTPREQMSNISKDLRSLQRLKKIPILAAAQLNREKQEENESPTTRNISESDRVGQDATTILFIERKENEQIVFTVGKARSARTGDKLTFIWNINLGKLQYLPTNKDALKGEGLEEGEDLYNDTGRSSDAF